MKRAWDALVATLRKLSGPDLGFDPIPRGSGLACSCDGWIKRRLIGAWDSLLALRQETLDAATSGLVARRRGWNNRR